MKIPVSRASSNRPNAHRTIYDPTSKSCNVRGSTTRQKSGLVASCDKAIYVLQGLKYVNLFTCLSPKFIHPS